MLTDWLGVPGVYDGRIAMGESLRYVIQVFCKREGRPSELPDADLRGQQIPGASGFSNQYSGYALRVADVSSDSTYELDGSRTIQQNSSGLTFQDISGHYDYLGNGLRGQIQLGLDAPRAYQITNMGGVYNGSGIDELIYSEVQGVPIRMTIGQVTT